MERQRDPYPIRSEATVSFAHIIELEVSLKNGLIEDAKMHALEF